MAGINLSWEGGHTEKHKLHRTFSVAYGIRMPCIRQNFATLSRKNRSRIHIYSSTFRTVSPGITGHFSDYYD